MRPSDLDDVCSVIGYTATRKLEAWFVGRHVWVPRRIDPDHPFAMLLGEPAARALVREFPGEYIVVPAVDGEFRYMRAKHIAERFAAGFQAAEIAAETGLSTRRIEQIRLELVEWRWIEYAGGFCGTARRGRQRADSPTTRPPTLVTEKLGTNEVFQQPPPSRAAGRG